MSERGTSEECASQQDAAHFCSDLGISAAAAREAVSALASSLGNGAGVLTEWSSADAPGAPTDIPPLYYAALLPTDSAGDMPLGLGDTPAAALSDLLWALGGPLLLADLAAGDAEPARAEGGAEQQGTAEMRSC
jgi:hypothetical protein